MRSELLRGAWRCLDREAVRAGRLVGPALAVLVGLLLVAHGCHGPDEDHEPAVVVDSDGGE